MYQYLLIALGKAAAIATCAVTWGAHSAEQLAAAQSDYQADTLDALHTLLMAGEIL